MPSVQPPTLELYQPHVKSNGEVTPLSLFLIVSTKPVLVMVMVVVGVVVVRVV